MKAVPAATAKLIAATVLGLIAFTAVILAQRDQGIARDEVVYMRAGARYWDWWADLLAFEDGTVTERRIASTFGGRMGGGANPEHPPLMKSAFGASEALFADALGWTSRTTASRLPTAAMFALLVALTALLTARVWGLAEGLIAGSLALLLPRMFFHAQLATFDVPVAALWLAAVVAWYRALRTRWGWLGFGVVYGLCLATKHNAILLPAVF